MNMTLQERLSSFKLTINPAYHSGRVWCYQHQCMAFSTGVSRSSGEDQYYHNYRKKKYIHCHTFFVFNPTKND